MQKYRERCDLIAGLVPFVRRLPTTDLETNSSTDALSWFVALNPILFFDFPLADSLLFLVSITWKGK